MSSGAPVGGGGRAPFGVVPFNTRDFELQDESGHRVARVYGEAGRDDGIGLAHVPSLERAYLLAASPGLLAALIEAEGALAVKASLRDGEQARVQRALEMVRSAIRSTKAPPPSPVCAPCDICGSPMADTGAGWDCPTCTAREAADAQVSLSLEAES